MAKCLPGMPCYSANNLVVYTYPKGCTTCSPVPCTFPLSSDNLIYTGPNLPNTGIQTDMLFTEALQRIDDIIDGDVVIVWGDVGGTVTNQTDLIAYLIANYSQPGDNISDFVNDAGYVTSGGITNTAAANELMKSNATNAVPSGIFSTTAGNATFGTGLTGSTRTFTAAGTATDVGFSFVTQGAASTVAFTTGNAVFTTPLGFVVTSTSGGASFTLANGLGITVPAASTDSVLGALVVTRTTTGTPSPGIGVSILFSVETSVGNNEVGATIEALTTAVSGGSENFDLLFKTMAVGTTATEKLRISSAGAIGIGGANYGTAGQVFTSGGSGAAPTWTTPTSSGVSGLTVNRIPYASSATTLADDSALTWAPTTDILTVGNLRINTTGTSNTFIGQSSGSTTLTGTSNTFYGALTGRDLTSGSENTCVGFSAGDNITDGTNNTSIGTSTLNLLTTGDFNTALGDRALATVASGSGNTSVGYVSLNTTTGSGNIALGYRAGDSITTGSNNIVIGYDITAQSATGNNQLSIQNIIFGTGNSAADAAVSTGNIGIGGPPVTDKFEIWHSGTKLLALTTDGRLFGTALHNNAGAITGATNQYIASGTYTPSVANQSNTSSLSADVAQFIRTGNVVTVSGKASLTYVSGGLCSFTISLPIASDFTDSAQCSGVAIKIISNFTHTDVHGTIEGGVTSNLAAVFFPARGAETTMTVAFTFTYVIV